MEDVVKEAVGEEGLRQFSQEGLEKDRCYVNIAGVELHGLAPVYLGLQFTNNCCIRRPPERKAGQNLVNFFIFPLAPFPCSSSSRLF